MHDFLIDSSLFLFLSHGRVEGLAASPLDSGCEQKYRKKERQKERTNERKKGRKQERKEKEANERKNNVTKVKQIVRGGGKHQGMMKTDVIFFSYSIRKKKPRLKTN